MFRKNEGYKQRGLFDMTERLTKKQKQMLLNSKEHIFFEHIFKNIDEEKFRVLYSTAQSRPNVAVNQLVGSLILKHNSNWTYEELFKNLSFNLLTRHAIGINDMEEDVFAEASLFNFQNRLLRHYLESGEDLLEQVFDSLTTQQLKEFDIKGNIQRGDSFLLASNIVDYTRLNLVLEVLLRLVRQLQKSDKEKVAELIAVYGQQTSSQYIYKLDKSDFPKELENLGKIYHAFHKLFKSTYGSEKVFKIFERVYFEHFKLVGKKVEVVDAKTLDSGVLMSPDDVDATYRKKGKKKSKGFVGHISETANPENDFNLITDVEVKANNVDDAKILEDRIESMIEKTPDLEEYHADGLYGSPAVDEKMKGYEIKQIQSTMRGRKSGAKIRMSQQEDGTLIANCEGGQQVVIIEKSKTYRAEFDIKKCNNCPLKAVCGAKETGVKSGNNPHRYKHFMKKILLAHIRLENIKTIPEQRRTLRANVEATVKECKRGIKNGKLRIRGLRKAKWYLVCTAIAINLNRIRKYLVEKAKEMADFGVFYLCRTLTIQVASAHQIRSAA